ncbi:MAG: prepilin-type N-terminal cleavage/methylation domain-containing protein [Patescibacteria group bacterium]
MRGFTLIETLIYLALFALLMSGAIGGVNAIQESAERTSKQTILIDEALYLEGRLRTEVEHADRIISPSKDMPSGTLTFEEDGLRVDIEQELGSLVQRISDEDTILNDNAVKVAGIAFTRSSSANDPQHIDISLTLQAQGAPAATVYSQTVYLSP